MQLLVCAGTGCHASMSDELLNNLIYEIEANTLEHDVQAIRTGCFGFCEKGPIVKVMPDNTFYTQVKPEDAREIIAEHIIKGRKVERLLFTDPETKEHIYRFKKDRFL
jgi:NADP-reducing hydrogenase subunit HndC